MCFFFNSNLIDAKNMQDGKTALILATQEGHLDVVNRLLDCKQIDVDVQSKVSGIVDRVPFPILFDVLFGMCFQLKFC